MRVTMEPLLYAAGVDIVLNGHLHEYERTHAVYVSLHSAEHECLLVNYLYQTGRDELHKAGGQGGQIDSQRAGRGPEDYIIRLEETVNSYCASSMKCVIVHASCIEATNFFCCAELWCE